MADRDRLLALADWLDQRPTRGAVSAAEDEIAETVALLRRLAEEGQQLEKLRELEVIPASQGLSPEDRSTLLGIAAAVENIDYADTLRRIANTGGPDER